MFAQRLFWLRWILLAAFAVFTGRLAYLQLLRGAELRQASEDNYYRWVSLPAPRGIISDRQGRVLAKNVPARTAWLVSGQVPRDREHHAWAALFDRLAAIGIYPDAATAREELHDAMLHPSYLPVRLKREVSLQDITRLEEEQAFLPGIYIKQEPMRAYPGGATAAHTLGYLREISEDELAKHQDQGYRLKDRIGKSGIERAYEETLRGSDGRDEVEVDALGRPLERYQSDPPQPGNQVVLTIDQQIQQAAEAALRGHMGAVVALDPATGDILAMASAPTYDLNQMSGHVSSQYFRQISAAHAEVNRATAGLYPPGSVFKIITAAAALEGGQATRNTCFYCDGSYYGIHCWQHSGHGLLYLPGALAHSCNVFFMHLAERTGPEALADMAARFGLGSPVDDSGVLHDRAGNLPDFAHMSKAERKAWPLGNTLQMGIGQSVITITPLQAARIIAVIANQGKLVHPRLVKRVGEEEQPIVAPTPLKLRASTISQIATGLREVVELGTAKHLDASLRIAGKTGTAQNPGGTDHAWFVGYAPVDHPKIAVAVLIEHGGHGGVIAAPIAETIIRAALQPPVQHQ